MSSPSPGPERRRGCIACGGKFCAAEQKDTKRHTCLTVSGAPATDLPGSCWQRTDFPVVRNMLEAIPAYLQRSEAGNVSHARRLEIAKDILASITVGSEEITDVDALIARHPRVTMTLFVRKIPNRSIKEQLENALRRHKLQSLEKWTREKKISRLLEIGATDEPDVPLSTEFESGLTAYLQQTLRIANIKHTHGHRYSNNSVRKRELDSRKFCVFLASQGLTFWAQIGQHHLDEYISVTDRWAAARIFTFLEFIRHHYRLTHKFVRPKTRTKPPIEAILPKKDVSIALKRLLASTDQEVIVMGLFLTFFAQMPTRSAELTYGRFRKRNGKIEALFSEQWTPLDGLTTKHLTLLLPDIGNTGSDREDALIFSRPIERMRPPLSQTLQVPMRPLRLAAVANLIRSGITDRGSLNRILGMSLPTLAYVEKSFEWDLHSTVDPEVAKRRNEVIRGERTE